MLDATENLSLPKEQIGPHQKRSAPDRSTVVFPYTHLEDALTIAQAIHENAVPLNRAQIAGLMQADPSSGGFSLKIGSARTFRLIESIDGRYKVTDLAERMLSSDETEARRARREAFLNAELYEKVYETYRNKPLPSRPVGLENAFVQFGVAPKQKDKARLAFERSAHFAGFFHAGKDRLVEPIIAEGSSSHRTVVESGGVVSMANTLQKDGMPPAAQQLLIKGLLERLPSPTETWSLDERVRWLRALAVNLAMIYGEKNEVEIVVGAAPIRAVVNATARTQVQSVSGPQTLKPTTASSGETELDDEIPF